jgi:hypothetical protein
MWGCSESESGKNCEGEAENKTVLRLLASFAS